MKQQNGIPIKNYEESFKDDFNILKRNFFISFLILLSIVFYSRAKTKVVFAGDTLEVMHPDVRISGHEKSSEEDEYMMGVFDYLCDAYSSHDFYQSGYWGKEWNEEISPVYTGKIPEEVYKDFYNPMKGRITSYFGYRPRYNRMHKGIDLKLNIGDTVRAAFSGTVALVDRDERGYGNYIILLHSTGLETRYGHLSGSLVRKGQTVKSGDPIALGGNTGNSTGPHLHFETRYKGLPLDPLIFFEF